MTQGLQIAEVLGRREEEARIRHRLGLALWSSGQLEAAHVHLDQAASLLEIIRRESTGSTDYKLSLFDLQTASYQALQVNTTFFFFLVKNLKYYSYIFGIRSGASIFKLYYFYYRAFWLP